jgi:hypothetical protein
MDQYTCILDKELVSVMLCNFSGLAVTINVTEHGSSYFSSFA